MNKFMRLFALLLVVVAIVLVVLSFKFGHHQSEQREAATPAPAVPATHARRSVPQTIATVVAATQLLPGQAISADELAMQETDKSKLREGYFTSIDQVVGKVPAVPVQPKQMLTKNLLLDDLSLKLLPGQRAVSVPVSEVSSSGNHIHAGDFVDVFFTLKHPLSPHSHDAITQSRLLLSRLRVLAYGSRNLPVPPKTVVIENKQKKKQGDHAPPPFSAHTATLAVPVAQVNQLLLASRNGKLALALRNPTDPAQPTTTLFPQPAPILIAQIKHHPKSKTDPTGSDPANAATAAINHAYAGISLGGVAHGSRHATRLETRYRVVPYHRVEIIRGTERSHITEHNGGSSR